MRLTNKVDYDYENQYGANNFKCDDLDMLQKVYDKLGQYEDIEDKLLMPDVVFHKLMEMIYCNRDATAYCLNNGKVVETKLIELDYCKKKLLFLNNDEEIVLPFSGYNQTWALTREEIENE